MSSNSSGKSEKTKLNFLILKAALVISHGNDETHHLMLKMKFKKSGEKAFSVAYRCIQCIYIYSF